MQQNTSTSPQTAGTLQPGSARYTLQALRVICFDLGDDGTDRHPGDAAAVLTRLEEQLGRTPTVPVEPPVDWDQVPAPTAQADVLQQLRNRIDDANYGVGDWDAIELLLDRVEDLNGWPHTWATEPRVQRDASGRDL